jgi:hypothetical protein
MTTTQDLVMAAIEYELARYQLILVNNRAFSNQGTMYAVKSTAGRRDKASDPFNLDPVGATLTYGFDMPSHVVFGSKDKTNPVVSWTPKRFPTHYEWVTDSFDQLVNIVVMHLRG